MDEFELEEEDHYMRPIHLPERRRQPENVELGLAEVRQEIQELREDVKGLVAAWNAASYAINAIKTIASVALAISSLIILIKSGLNVKN